MDKREELKQLILDKGVIFNQGIQRNGKPQSWMIDSRQVLLDSEGSVLAAELLYEIFKKFSCNYIGGLTLAADPIVSQIILKAGQDKKDIKGFIIRKNRKEIGLQRLIEGNIKKGAEVILVDDLINSGRSIFRAIKAVEEYGCKVKGILTIVNFDNEGYKSLIKRGYKVEYLFTLEDFYIENKTEISHTKPEIIWELNDINQWEEIVPRSNPIIHNGNIYFGSNEGIFYCLDKNNGNIKWQLKEKISNPKGILSSPIIYNNKVYFGAYNGFLYCLNTDNGEIIWKIQRGDWIGSSPCIHDNKLFIGVEYGNKGGVLIAVSADDGKLLWYLKTNHYIHSSPAVDKKKNIVIVGCNDGYVYTVNAKTGKLLWKYNIGRPIKAGFAIDEETELVYFGAFDGFIYCFGIKTGKIIWSKKVGTRIYSTPEIVNDNLIFSTVSGRIFVLEKNKGSIKWYYHSEKQIYSNTNTANDKIYCGSNDGFLCILDLNNGNLIKRYNIGAEILTKPLIIDNQILLGCKGKFVCVNQKNQ